MKTTITLLLVLFTSIATFGQKIDLVNAPINPIALEYKKEHFNLKGDVYGYGYRVFSKEGMLIYEYGISRGLHYLYKNGFPFADTEGKLYEFNSEGYLSKKTYASLGVQTQTYTYNPKGLLTKVINTKGYNATYEYDDKGRLSKSNVGGNIREFSYQKSGEQLLVTVKDLSKTPAVVTKHIYKNGVEIGRNDKLFDLKYDNHGNKSGYDNAIYYSDIENRNNEISVVYTKSTYSIDPLTDCKFYINGQKADFLYKQIASIQSKDIFIYNPFTEKYYIVENAIDDTKSGQKQVFSKVFINSPYYLLNRKSASLSLGYKGAELANTANGMRDGALKVYNTPVYVAYDRTLNQTFYGELDNTNASGYYPLQQISPNDNVVYLKAGENQFTVVIEGKVNAKENPNHKLYNSTDGGSILIDDKNKPLYYLPGTATATINKLYAGRKYNPATDKIQSANNTTPTQTTTKSTSANNTAGQPNTTAEASSLVAFSKNKPLYFKKITNAQVQFYQDETKITPPEKFFKSYSGDLIAYYEPGYYYILSNVENATLNTIIKPNYQIANDFYYEVLSKDETYVNRKGKYLKLSDFKLYVGANGVLNFMFPEEDVTYTSNMGNGSLYSKYYSGGEFKGTDYLDIKKDKSFDLIRRGVRIPKSDYEVKVDVQNDNQAFIYYKGKKEFKISHYKSFFDQAYLRSITRVQ